MKNLIIFSDSPAVKKSFASVESSRSWNLSFHPVTELRTMVKDASGTSLFLFDYASVPEDEKQRNLNYLLKKNGAAAGLIDRKNEITDPAVILMKGTDYFSSSMLKEGIKPARLNKSLDFHEKCISLTKAPSEAEAETSRAEGSSGTGKNAETGFIIPEGGWKGIKSGHEYTFFMLFTEISIPAGWKKKSGSVHLNQLKETFQSVVEREITACDGRVWIWNEYGGLVLFPFDGSSSEAVLPAVKLMLNRVLISVEDFQLHRPINLRAAMHLGTTKYKARGKTGTLISDSINSIFHLGTKYTPIDDFDITENVYEILPDRVKRLFREAGSFENRDIFRLRHFEVKG